MTVYVTAIRQSGTKRWAHLFVEDEKSLTELERMAERLKEPVKVDGRGVHVDVSVHEAELAVRYGAIPTKV